MYVYTYSIDIFLPLYTFTGNLVAFFKKSFQKSFILHYCYNILIQNCTCYNKFFSLYNRTLTLNFFVEGIEYLTLQIFDEVLRLPGWTAVGSCLTCIIRLGYVPSYFSYGCLNPSYYVDQLIPGGFVLF